jgi:hypothetical protein
MLSYNYPGVSNNVMVSPETYAALAAHKNIVGCKMYVNCSSHSSLRISKLTGPPPGPMATSLTTSKSPSTPRSTPQPSASTPASANNSAQSSSSVPLAPSTPSVQSTPRLSPTSTSFSPPTAPLLLLSPRPWRRFGSCSGWCPRRRSSL